MQVLILKDSNQGSNELRRAVFGITLWPCGAELEIILKVDHATNIPNINDFKVADLKRTNLYGNQSECVDTKELKMVCCCHSYLKTIASS